MLVRSLGQEDPLEEGTAAHPSILAWRIPLAEEPGRLQSMGLQRAGHDRSNSARMHTQYPYSGQGFETVDIHIKINL